MRRNTASNLRAFQSCTHSTLLSRCSVFLVLLAFSYVKFFTKCGAIRRCAVATFGHLRLVNSLRLSSRALSCLYFATAISAFIVLSRCNTALRCGNLRSFTHSKLPQVILALLVLLAFSYVKSFIKCGAIRCRAVATFGHLRIVNSLRCLTQREVCFAFGQRVDDRYVHAHLAPKRHSQCLFQRAARPRAPCLACIFLRQIFYKMRCIKNRQKNENSHSKILTIFSKCGIL